MEIQKILKKILCFQAIILILKYLGMFYKQIKITTVDTNV